MKYSPNWDLTTIPDLEFASERARRVAAKRVYQPKLAACPKCGQMLSARQRRYRCPEHLDPAERNPGVRKKVKRALHK